MPSRFVPKAMHVYAYVVPGSGPAAMGTACGLPVHPRPAGVPEDHPDVLKVSDDFGEWVNCEDCRLAVVEGAITESEEEDPESDFQRATGAALDSLAASVGVTRLPGQTDAVLRRKMLGAFANGAANGPPILPIQTKATAQDVHKSARALANTTSWTEPKE